MGTKSIILDDARAVTMINHSIRAPRFHRSFDHRVPSIMIVPITRYSTIQGAIAGLVTISQLNKIVNYPSIRGVYSELNRLTSDR